MTTNRTTRALLVLAGCTAAGAVGLALAGQRPGATGQPPVPPAAPRPDDRPADRDAVTAALATFAATFQKGDGKALAALWTAGGEYLEGDGTSFRGREALAKAYAEFFARSPDNALEVEVDAIRFPSRDTAVVEGHFKLRKGPRRELTVSRCSFLYAREDGGWRIAIAREWPGDGHSLRDLEWLVGTWEAKPGGTAVSTAYEWAGDKAFIRCRFSITADGRTTGGTQMIGRDPATGALRVWTFEDAGGVGTAELTREGARWVFSAAGTTADGQEVTATNLMTPVDADTFVWQATRRTHGGEELPDLPPVRVTRVKAKR